MAAISFCNSSTAVVSEALNLLISDSVRLFISSDSWLKSTGWSLFTENCDTSLLSTETNDRGTFLIDLLNIRNIVNDCFPYSCITRIYYYRFICLAMFNDSIIFCFLLSNFCLNIIALCLSIQKCSRNNANSTSAFVYACLFFSCVSFGLVILCS